MMKKFIIIPVIVTVAIGVTMLVKQRADKPAQIIPKQATKQEIKTEKVSEFDLSQPEVKQDVTPTKVATPQKQAPAAAGGQVQPQAPAKRERPASYADWNKEEFQEAIYQSFLQNSKFTDGTNWECTKQLMTRLGLDYENPTPQTYLRLVYTTNSHEVTKMGACNLITSIDQNPTAYPAYK